MTRFLKGLTYKDMQYCFLQWKNRWARCIQLGGTYIEDYVPTPEYVYTNLEYHSREHHPEEIQSEHKCSNLDNNMELDRSIEESRCPEIITSQCIIKEEIDIVDESELCSSWNYVKEPYAKHQNNASHDLLDQSKPLKEEINILEELFV
ncbi:uncharacterized protein LOC105200630 isoform X2 [Solenopsis invicta]|nr:uncharacterized protein LOC105200630 isoform X2 [Solenopsis invicta]